ncbi:MAG: acetyl-CoA hydrolase/transferase C-terminal domain-containing protein [Candidatus Dormiibacterota bacterium]
MCRWTARSLPRAARLRIVQINPRMPRTHGDSFIHLNDFDAVIEVDEPLPEASAPVISAEHLAVGRNVAELIEDGATLQLGIGAIPNAVLGLLGDRRELGVHSEVVSDGVLELVSAGVITGSRKTINRGKLVVAFLNGSRRLYDFADDNPMLEMRSFEYTNDTRTILRLDNMVAITLADGAGVTTSRAHVHWVATEHGRIDRHGMDLAHRAHALIALAAPRFQDELTAAALRRGLFRDG